MGYYIDPPDMSKEKWLIENAKPSTKSACEEWSDFSTEVPVVLVDNGFFTAAGIAYDEREVNAFTQPDDKRSKVYFTVEKTKLFGVNPSYKEFCEQSSKY